MEDLRSLSVSGEGKLSNRLAIAQVIAGLMQDPTKLYNREKYRLSIEDFPETLYRLIFAAIEHLATNAMAKINQLDIDQFWHEYPGQYAIFTQSGGPAYLSQALEIYDAEKFDYYYNLLKKYSLVNCLTENGIDTRDIFDPELVDPQQLAKAREKFDNMTVDEILRLEEIKLTTVKDRFGNSSDRVENTGGEGLRELKEHFKKTPEMGATLLSSKLTTIVRGQRRGCLFIESAPSGTGKALPNSSRLPTPSGWTTVGAVKRGDYLFDALGRPTQVLDVFPQGQKEVFEVTFADGRKVRCCDEHLWSYNTPGQKPYSRDARNFCTKTLREIRDEGLMTSDGAWRVRVPMQKAVGYPTRTHWLPPYVLGLLLGDGSLRMQATNSGLTYSSETSELPARIADIMGWTYKKNSEYNYNWNFELSDAEKSLMSNGRNRMRNVSVAYALQECPELINAYSHTKFIPRQYLEDSEEHRWDLLNGLLDTDGSVGPKGRVSYTTTSEQLAQDVMELVYSLGMSATLRKVDTRKQRSCYSIGIAAPMALKQRLFTETRKKARLMAWCTGAGQRRATHTVSGNAIVKIESLGYTEEMTCFLVDNDEHLFLTDDFVVTHNSRRGNGECCHLAVPEYYNVQQQQWLYTGNHERVLMISTELELAECQQMWLAFVSGVSETHIKDGRYEPGEEERVDRAIKLIENANLYFVSITNFDTDDIVHIIRKYVQLHQVGFVFFDYLGETLKITSSATRKSGVRDLRTDQVLLALSQALKDTAKTLGIYIWTASQLSGNYKGETKELDATYLRSAKSIADKVDAGMILMPVREPDIPIIDSYCARGFDLRPNFVIHVYKVRAGSYQNIKVYVYFDRGTCQITDCFVTDQDGNILPIRDTYIERVLDDTKTDNFAEAVGAPADSWDEEDY